MTITPAVAVPAAVDGPYVGLIPYSQENAAIFFGRDAERTALISNLRASRLTLLYAQSGVGKSSVLRAGVAARLTELARRSFEQRGSPRYIPVVFSAWQDEPTDELIAEIQRAVIPFLPSASPLQPPAKGLPEAIEAASRAAGATLLVMLDQFEEYLLYRSREARDGRFADEIAACINRANLHANFLISIREDAYSALGDLFQGRVINVYGNYFHLEHLTRESARHAIEKPIATYNLLHQHETPVEIAPDLVGVIIGQLKPDQFTLEQGGMGRLADGNGAGHRDGEVAAPYLQLVMRRLWETELARGSRTLRRETLEELGGPTTIVQNYVDLALGNLQDDERKAAADILRYLVTPSGTKIALAASDLADYTEHPEAEVDLLLGRLTSILRRVPPPPGREDGVRFEISHDLLAPAILDWVGRRRAARLEHEKKIAERKAENEKRRAQIFRALAIVSAVLLVVTVILAIAAANATRQAILHRDIAVSMQVAGESEALAQQQPWVASQLAVAAWRIHHTPQAYASMLNVLAQPNRGVLLIGQGHNRLHSVTFGPDGKTVASAGPTGTAGLWNVQGRHLINTHGIFRTMVYSVGFSPDGKTLATGGAHGQARLWDIATGHQVGTPLTGGPGWVTSVAFSRDGHLLATAGTDSTARLWDVTTHRQLHVFHASTGAVNAVAFSPDGRLLATAGQDGTARLWNVTTHRQLHVFHASTGRVTSVAFSRDGHILATAGADGTARLWNATTHRQLHVFHASTGAVNAVAFSPDGRTLATAGQDGTARLWNVTTYQQLAGPSLAVSGIPLFGVAFSPNDHTIATAGADGTVRLWDTVTYREIGSSIAVQSATNSVAVSHDGHLLATAGADGTARLWNVTTHRQVYMFHASTGAVNAVAFSPDGRLLATAGADGTARLWNVTTHRQVYMFHASTGGVTSVAFSRYRHLLATAGADGTARLWNVTTHRQVYMFHASTGRVNAVAFSPDGRTLATASQDGTARLWNAVKMQRKGAPFESNFSINSVAFSPRGTIMATAGADAIVRLWNDKILNRFAAGRSIGAPFTFTGQVSSVAFSPDGRLLATAGQDGTARLWDVRTHQQVGAPLTAGSGLATDVAFSPHGGILITTDADGTTRLWNVSLPHRLQSQVCSIAHGSLGFRQWKTYIPNAPFMKVC